MKLRTRLAAMVLTILLTAQLPVSVFANSAASTAQTQGQIVVTDENGQEQILTAEQLQSGENLPENIVINNETTQTQETETAASASESTPAANSTSTPAASESTPAANSTSAPAASESTPAANSTSTPAVSESTPTASSDQRVDLDLPIVQNTDDKAQRVDIDLPLVQATDTTGNRVEETVSLNQAASSDSAAASDEQEEKEEALPYIYWNPGQGYDVDPSYLETQKAESDSTSESESTSESTSESASASESVPSSSSAPASSSAPVSAPASSSAPESAPASSSAPASAPASSSAPASAPASSSAPASAPASGSAPESAPASGSVPESAPASSSAPESAPASGSVPESAPASSSVPVSTPAPSSTPDAAQVPGNDAAAEPAPQPVHEAAQEAGFVEQAGQVLDNLNPVQTAHAADTLEPEQEKGFFAGVLEWLSWLFSPITQFFKDLAAFALSSNYVPAGDDANTGRSPLAPVKSFDAAMQRARELSAELGVSIEQITIYMMNPLEITTGQQVEINTDMAILKAWEGRNYDSDMLFYLMGGTLSVRNTVMTPRVIDPANMQDAAKTLVWLYGGSLVLENNVSAYGGFVLDFYQQESARVWNAAASLAAQKYETPVIRLGESFAPVGMGYAIQFKEADREIDQLELVQAPYIDQAQMQEYAKSFTVTGETASEWEYEVMAQEQAQAQQAQARTMARMATQDGGKTSASASLYAVRASGVVIYWNPGGQLTINGTTYPAGSDIDRTGLAPSAPLKTLTMAIEMAKKSNTTRIICMRTLEIDADTANNVILEQYLPYDQGTKTFQLHSDLISGVPVELRNWDQGLPIINISDGYNLSMKNVTLQGYATETTNRVGNLLTVGTDSTVTLNENAAVLGGSYIQMTFQAAEGIPPNPIMVNSMEGTSATIYASGIAFAPHFNGTTLVQATDELVASAFSGDKNAAGAALEPNFVLDKANTTPSTEGGQNQVLWSLVQDVRPGKEHSLVLSSEEDYSAIYIDPIRGDDTYLGVTCEFPVQTLARALELMAEVTPQIIEKREKAFELGAEREDIDDNYPLPGMLYACSPIEVTTQESWDWTQYHWTDYDGVEIRPLLSAHDDAPEAEDGGGKLHERPYYVVRVGAGGNLTLGDFVRIGRFLPDDGSVSESIAVWNSNIINVVDGGALTLTGNAELTGLGGAPEDIQGNLYKTYPGTGIVAGVKDAFNWTTGVGKKTVSQATVTLSADWTGKIHHLSRGVLLCGKDVSMTMDGGEISGNKNNYTGAGVSLFQSAQFTMNGGKISGNYAAAGAGVLVDGYVRETGVPPTKFTMKEGEISDNTIDRYAKSSYTDYMGGAGVQTYYGEFEMGTEGADNALCKVVNNRFSRRGSANTTATTGIGISIFRTYSSSTSNPSFIMKSGTVSGNCLEDRTDMSYAYGLNLYGLGIGTYYVDSILVENGIISQNQVKMIYSYNGSSSSSYYQNIFGGGMYVGPHNSNSYLNIVLRSLTVTENGIPENTQIKQSYYVYFYGGGLSFSYALGGSTNEPGVLLEDVQVTNNTLYKMTSQSGSLYGYCYGGGIDFRGNNGSYAVDIACLENVTVQGNVAQGGSGGGIFGGFHWAKNLTVDSNQAESGGGWFRTSGNSNSIKRETIVEDAVFTNNTATNKGGAIYWGYQIQNGYTWTLTESAPGKTKIQGNQAQTCGGVYISYASSKNQYYFDFSTPWDNEATGNEKRGKELYIFDHQNADIYLLQGTLKGTNSVYIQPTISSSSYYNGTLTIDPEKVKFEPDQPGESMIYLNHPSSRIRLLTAGSSANPLHLTLNEEYFDAGNVIFRPANLDKVELGAVAESPDVTGGLVGAKKEYAYTPLKSAAESSKPGETWSDYITVTGTPLRTQIGEASAAEDQKLTNLELIGEGVYLDGVNGLDTNNGLSPKSAVKTLRQAKLLLEQYSEKPPQDAQQTTGFQPTVWVCGMVTLESGSTTLTLPQSIVSEKYKTYETAEGRTPQLAAVRRLSSYNQALFSLEDGAVVTVTNMRVDGNSAAMMTASDSAYNFLVKTGAVLKLDDGARSYESYGSNIALSGGSLEVTQGFTPSQVDSVNDEKYGVQISSESKRKGSYWGAVRILANDSKATLKGNAFVGSTKKSGAVFYLYGAYTSNITVQDDAIVRGQYAFYHYSSGAITDVTLQNNAIVYADYGFYWASADTTTTVLQKDKARVEASTVLYQDSYNGTGLLTWTMEGDSQTKGTSYFCNEYDDKTAKIIRLYDNSQMSGSWYEGNYIYQSTSDQRGSTQIIMGKPGGDDAPILTANNLQCTGGQLYLEMNANSKLKGSIQFRGLSAPAENDRAKPAHYGVYMRDNAEILSNSSEYALYLYMYYYNTSSITDSSHRRWDQTTPFQILLENNAAVGPSSSEWTGTTFSPIYVNQSLYYNNLENIQQYFMMGDGQGIVLRDNAALKGYGYYGAIRSVTSLGTNVPIDPNAVTPLSAVTIEGSSVHLEKTTTAMNNSQYVSNALITARKVTLKGAVSLPDTGNAAANPLLYGQGASIKAWALELDGTASVAGAICLLGKDVAENTIGNITLTSPITAADTGRYKLQLAANYMGQIVVAPGGGTVTDASIYLDCFKKLCGESEAANVELKAMAPNIVLDREWNVYLSTNGDDKNDGSTPQKAVRTFARAKDLLTTVKGYGTGSNIIIPDSVTVQNHDKLWSFEEGGVLTSATGELWKPSISRMNGVVYTDALIRVDSGAYSTSASYGQSITAEQAAAPVVFENITIDDGGKQAKFALSGTGYDRYNLSMLYVNTGSISREVTLGENVLMHNLDYDMANSGVATTQLEINRYTGGFAVTVIAGTVVMDGAVIENFNVKNYYHYQQSYNYYQNAAIVSASSENSAIEMREGAVRNNSLEIKAHHLYYPYDATGIVAMSRGARFDMSGGEISGNVLSGPEWGKNGNIGGSYYGSGTRAVGVVALASTNTASQTTRMTLSGGKIRGNTNRLGIDETSAARNAFACEGIISVGMTNTSGNYGVEFTMSGGNISENKARYGSAFMVLNGTATLSGGAIRSNQSVAPVPTEGEPTGWKAEYCPIYVGTYNDKKTRLNLKGSGCVADDPLYLSPGRQIVITDQLRQTNRLYEIYTGTGATAAGNLVVIPDGDVVLDATPYLHNFHAHAAGMVLDRGRESRQVTTQLGPMNEQTCLVQMKAVFVNGDTGNDPEAVDLAVPQDTLGRSTDQPVQTFDAAKAVGQALCYAGEDQAEHAKHKNHYVVYATGTVYNDLYAGTVTDSTNVIGVPAKNENADGFVFSFEGAAYMCRYTGWALCMGNGLHKAGGYCYDSLVEIHADSGTTTLQNFILRGRREVDSTENNGETLVVVQPGAKLVMSDGAGLERNNVSGSRPSEVDPDIPAPINTKGGAVRVEAGAEMLMQGGIIDNTCTSITGSSIYLTGKEDPNEAAKLTLQNKLNIGGEIYLGGQQGYDTPILVDKSFVPTQPVTIGIQGDYNKKPVVQWTDNTEVTEEMVGMFSFSTSITALYEVLPGNVTGTGGTNNGIVLNLRNILYLDPQKGDDRNDGRKPEQAVKTIGRIYDMFENQGSVPGVLVFVMNPIVVPQGQLVVLTNGSVLQGQTRKYLSIYYEGPDNPDFDTTVGIYHNEAQEKVIQSQLYFKRYVKTSDDPIPEYYNAETNLNELFIVEGQLQLNGVYLDGHSNTTVSDYPGNSAEGVTAQAPLVRVEPTGSAQFLAGEMTSHEIDGKKYQAENTLFTNNINNRQKQDILPGTVDVVEGSSAGIEIRSANTDQGYAKEQRGKVVLLNTRFVNLKLGADDSGKIIMGGSDIYQNGELAISNNVYFEGNIFLEGNGRNGETQEDKLARQTSRWIDVSAYGSPVAGAFEVLVRDAYHNRRMVKYPYSTSNIIPESEISYYMLNSEVSRYFTLINELFDKGEGEDFLGTGENTLWLRVPQAVYIDPENGNDQWNGQYPETAVKTLQMAFQRMRGLSAKVLYVVNTIPVDGMSFIYPTGYSYDEGVVPLPSNNVHLEIRRYVQPDDNGGSASYYKTPSFTDGPLFRVQEHGQLTIEGSVVVNGHSEALLGSDVPPSQEVSKGVEVTAPLVEVLSGGVLDLRIDTETGERAVLMNNSNTASLAADQTRIEGGAINNKGSVIFNGGMLENNKAALVTSPGITAKGKADGVYQAGDMTISAYPQGLEGQSIFLASDVSENDDGETNFTEDHILTMDMRLEDEVTSANKKLTYSLDMDNAMPGRQVISYPGDSQVDSEYSSYILGTTVHEELFLAESEDTSSNLELQDWKVLNVSVPEEVFLTVYEYHNRDGNAPYGSGVYTEVGRADVSGAEYGVPEYTITNNGLYGAKVTVKGFIQQDWQKDISQSGMQLAQSTTELSGTSPLLYMAITKSSETEEQGNQFASLAETSLKGKTAELSIALGTLQASEHGSFAFTGAANAAFMNLWTDAGFPISSLASAQQRIDYMRNEDALGETSLNNASAQFKLTYRIEIDPARR